MKLAIRNDSNCLRVDDRGVCVECAIGYYISSQSSSSSLGSFSGGSGSTVSGCQIVSQLCLVFNYTQSICAQCQPGYFLQDGYCIYPSLGYDPYCKRYSGSYCSSCVSGYYLSNFICMRVSTNCIEFNDATSLCVRCATGKPSGPTCI